MFEKRRTKRKAGPTKSSRFDQEIHSPEISTLHVHFTGQNCGMQSVSAIGKVGHRAIPNEMEVL